ncbi:MAG: hypothetical protein U5N56_11105 [Candidatus Marinimicrobia bacterium]|nr:hypothetical protein [Candidatus Neomarinimicrobiota bacterium]
MPHCVYISFSASCEYIAFTPQDTSDPVSNFHYLWEKVDKQYAYFDVKNVDWDSVYVKYSEKIHQDLTDDSCSIIWAVC